jgi:hypothetical protein
MTTVQLIAPPSLAMSLHYTSQHKDVLQNVTQRNTDNWHQSKSCTKIAMNNKTQQTVKASQWTIRTTQRASGWQWKTKTARTIVA